MRFYTRPHWYYCGIDLHARTMYVVVIDQTAQALVERNRRFHCSGENARARPFQVAREAA